MSLANKLFKASYKARAARFASGAFGKHSLRQPGSHLGFCHFVRQSGERRRAAGQKRQDEVSIPARPTRGLQASPNLSTGLCSTYMKGPRGFQASPSTCMKGLQVSKLEIIPDSLPRHHANSPSQRLAAFLPRSLCALCWLLPLLWLACSPSLSAAAHRPASALARW